MVRKRDVEGVKAMVKERYVKVMKAKGVNDRVMAVVLVFFKGYAEVDLRECAAGWKNYERQIISL